MDRTSASPQPRFSLRQSLLPGFSLAWTAGAVALTALLMAAHSRTLSFPIDPADPLTLAASGAVTQAGKTVAWAVPQPDGTLRVTLLLGNDAARTATETHVALLLPQDVSQPETGTQFESIQGTEGMRAALSGPRTISVSTAPILPDSHTDLLVTLPARLVQPSILQGLLYRLILVSNSVWLALAAAGLLLGCLISLVTVSRRRPGAGQPRSLPPENISPLQLSLLLTGHIKAADITAVLYDMANRGFLQFVHKNNGIGFFRMEGYGEMAGYERLFLELLTPNGSPGSLERTLDDLSLHRFSQAVGEAYVDAYDRLDEQGCFQVNPRLTHLRFKTAGILTQFVCLALGVFAFFFLQDFAPAALLLSLSGFCTGWLTYRSGYRVIALSRQGMAAVGEGQAFARYLSQTSLIGPEGAQGILYYRYLPYALVLGVSPGWLARFSDVRFFVPQWFVSQEVTMYGPAEFNAYAQEVSSLIAQIFVSVKDPNAD